MATISVPLNSKQTETLEYLVKQRVGANRADVMRKALEKLSEEEAVQMVLRAQKEMGEGKVLYGDLRELAKKIR
ncbi:hypothetical protein A2671_02280 [Candidatus Kaiserbacteria bacterium RIFCSPHIGHO2_01_FULL_49_13]|uniref:Ribbon-helix-helix protein CopG domain-containing protein n=1 Tax=Candidatus Kaiserbacteria bacterium RIFCSPHIGHO2_01_FULL_49_13 TaxID=1798477 RepID=A0A1F6CDV7_9BACT|nr:MAG: hypothetical protein A2671_02280 [Candidatus Kaiserbacteria bacterium RIFCSPHIGHO2_01_FULL_49_13]